MGKSINLFLMDDEGSGRIKCSLANWTGVAYKIPRTLLERCKDRGDLKQSGVYFLFGVSDATGENVVYVGQAGSRKNGEGILHRLMEHHRNPDKDYWTEAVVFTTSNNSFGPTEISYLENRFCGMALEAGRYIVKNGNEPAGGHVTEEKECELEEFIGNARLIMGALGHRVFTPLDTSGFKENGTRDLAPDGAGGAAKDKDSSVGLFYLKRKIRMTGREIVASCKQTAEGFVVLKGSVISEYEFEDLQENVKKLRQKAEIDQNRILQEDVLCTSPSSAAAFVVGTAANGWKAWKDENGKTLKELGV